MKLKPIIDPLVEQAKVNAEKAYQILGARPGPGIDIEIWPVEPICGKWFVSGCTPAGRAFVQKYWTYQPLDNNHVLGKFKRHAIEWGLTFRTIYNAQSLSGRGTKYD